MSVVVQTLATPDLSFGSRKNPQLLMSRSQQSPQIYAPEGEQTKNSISALILPETYPSDGGKPSNVSFGHNQISICLLYSAGNQPLMFPSVGEKSPHCILRTHWHAAPKIFLDTT